MLQGIAGHGYYDNCTVPIIENTARECELTDRLRQAIQDYPKSQAVLVRRHGVYVWGPTWIQAKTQAECYDYLFEAAVKMKAMGVDATQPANKAPAAQANGALQNGHDHGIILRQIQLLHRCPAFVVQQYRCVRASAPFYLLVCWLMYVQTGT